LFKWTLSKPTWSQIGAEIVVTRSRIDAVKSKKTPTLLQCKSKMQRVAGVSIYQLTSGFCQLSPLSKVITVFGIEVRIR
jgi:hypothetical protein